MARREDTNRAGAERKTKAVYLKLCGCVVTCIGDAEHEPRITYCLTHAAAPELLAALRAAIDEHDHYPSDPRPCDWESCWCHAARAAIRKATEGA